MCGTHWIYLLAGVNICGLGLVYYVNVCVEHIGCIMWVGDCLASDRSLK